MSFIIDTRFREARLPGMPHDLDFSNDGKLLACATCTDDGLTPVIRVLQTKDGSMFTHFMQSGVVNGRGVAFINTGTELVFLFQDGSDRTILYRAALDSTDLTHLQDYQSSAKNHAIVRDSSGQRFAVLGNTVGIWDVSTARARVLHHLRGNDNPCQAAFSRDGSHIYVTGIVDSMVVRYHVETAKETGRWATPYSRSKQVLVTPDERFLLVVGSSGKGVFIYDLNQGTRLLTDTEERTRFDQEMQYAAWAVTPDSRLLLCLKGKLRTFLLPDLEDVTPPETMYGPGKGSWTSASAWDVPMVAFVRFAERDVRWFSFESNRREPDV
jgi:WD40 repeat protein